MAGKFLQGSCLVVAVEFGIEDAVPRTLLAAASGKELIVEPPVIDFIIEKGFQPEFGARPLRRAVERYIEDPLAEEILRGRFEKAKKVRVELDQQKILFFPED